jgi:hypothetical protein
VIGTDCMCSYKPNNHMVMTMTAPVGTDTHLLDATNDITT